MIKKILYIIIMLASITFQPACSDSQEDQTAEPSDTGVTDKSKHSEKNVQWAHDRAHFEKLREEIHKMHEEVDKEFFGVEEIDEKEW